MRTLALLGVVLAVLAITAVASPWVALGLEAAGWPFRFSRVYNRVFEVLLVVALVVAWRRLDLGGLADVGLRDSRLVPRLGRGWVCGLVGVTVALLLAWLGGGLVPELRYPPLKTLRKALLGLVGAGLIGVGEEVLFRGLLLRRLRTDLGPRLGLAVTTLLYAVVHALRFGGGRAPAHAWAGVERTLAIFEPLAAPGVLQSVVGLAALGSLLAWARLRAGLWTAIGIHAAWVAAFRVGRLLFDIRHQPAWLVGPGWPPLVGGVAGWVGIATCGAFFLFSRSERVVGASGLRAGGEGRPRDAGTSPRA